MKQVALISTIVMVIALYCAVTGIQDSVAAHAKNDQEERSPFVSAYLWDGSVAYEEDAQTGEGLPVSAYPYGAANDHLGEDWMLVLVNAHNPLPDGFTPSLATLPNGLEFDARAVGELERMLADARQQGLAPLVCSAYRDYGFQQTLFGAEVARYRGQGLSLEEASTVARKSVAYPGTSEHHLGLAADIVPADHQVLDEAQSQTPLYAWLVAHCADYGFILRYPANKTGVTGIMFEPWHYRYVGYEAAQAIMRSGLCLEEYLGAA
ncbi:MAG: M15 family metallopeptidase [Coriobacteriales bacterium]|jgi:D-alanyl-D-alanine carboxypeptidase|nr:M15 family metallopeptidase [Coriobacteriales bacterium]